MPSEVPPTEKRAYFMAGIEDVLQELVGGGSKMAGDEVMPQTQVALPAG